MRLTTPVLISCVWAAAALSLHADPLATLLAQMDKSAAVFRGMTAKLHRTTYTAVIKDTSEEEGSIVIRQAKPKDMQVLVDFSSPDQKTWAFRGRKAELFVPKMNTVQEYDLGKHGRLIDGFLLLGFGSNSKDLERNYTLKLGPEETLDGRKTSKLELIPKSEEAREHLKKVEIWFPSESGSPVQQKFYLGSGDYMLVRYSETKLDPNLPEAAVRLRLPSNVKREYPQK